MKRCTLKITKEAENAQEANESEKTETSSSEQEEEKSKQLNLDSLTVAQLKEIADKRGLKYHSRINKGELVLLIESGD